MNMLSSPLFFPVNSSLLLIMEFSSIWFFSISSLVSLVFLTTGVYCLDKAILISIPHDWFMYQIQEWIAYSVMFSISYAFLFRPPLEHQELDATLKLFDFYGLFHPVTLKSLLFPFLPLYSFYRFHDKISLITSFVSEPLLLCSQSMLYFHTYGNRNLLARIASPLLLYPYHSLSWIYFIVLMFFSLCASFEDKYTLVFPSGKCLSIWGLNSYVFLVLQSISFLACIVFFKSVLMLRSSILIYAYEQRKLFEIIFGLLFVILAQYFFIEKSLPLMFAFMSFAITWLGNFANVQLHTDFGIFQFFVSSSLECAVSLYGLHIYTFLVLSCCIVLEILRWKIDSVSLRHTGMRQSVYLDWVCTLGEPRRSSPSVVVAREESEPPEGEVSTNRENASGVTVEQ